RDHSPRGVSAHGDAPSTEIVMGPQAGFGTAPWRIYSRTAAMSVCDSGAQVPGIVSPQPPSTQSEKRTANSRAEQTRRRYRARRCALVAGFVFRVQTVDARW